MDKKDFIEMKRYALSGAKVIRDFSALIMIFNKTNFR